MIHPQPGPTRLNVPASDRHVTVNVLISCDPAATLADAEAAIKAAARTAITRVREVLG